MNNVPTPCDMVQYIHFVKWFLVVSTGIMGLLVLAALYIRYKDGGK